MWVYYAYCAHCGSEYLEKTYVFYIRSTPNGDCIECVDCGSNIWDFDTNEFKEDKEIE